jgi:hypothetical protein
MMDIDVDAMGILGPEGHPMRSVEQRERKRFRISDGEKQKARSLSKKGPTMGLEPPHVGMSKRSDLLIEEKAGTSHQAALVIVIGDIKAITTGIGYGQCAPRHSKGMGSQRGE